LTAANLETYRQKIREIHVEPSLIKYIAQLVSQTRNHSALYLGASPRASLAILNSSKALAGINGRDFVRPEDIKEVVFPVFRHRILLTPEKEMEGIEVDTIIKQIIQAVEIPR
jgi:MoxR-like ATPase